MAFYGDMSCARQDVWSFNKCVKILKERERFICGSFGFREAHDKMGKWLWVDGVDGKETRATTSFYKESKTFLAQPLL